jgi:hypothetical protein
MPDDKPKALDDVRKGLGLLFRAARTTVEKLPTKDLEEVVVTSAREVGRALESVGKTIEREVFGKKGEGEPSKAKAEGASKDDEAKPQEKPGEAKPRDGADGKPPDAA